jgi:hypothetical protein
MQDLPFGSYYQIRYIDKALLMNSQEVMRLVDLARRPRSRRANLATRGVLPGRRSDREMKRNAEIGLLAKS